MTQGKEARTRTVLKEYKEIVRMMGETYSLDQGSAKRDEEMKRRLNSIMAKHTGQSVKQIEADLERDNFMSAAAAVEYGLIDTVLEKREKKDDETDI